MANIPVSEIFNTGYPEVTDGTSVIYTTENAKLAQLLSNDLYNKKAIEAALEAVGRAIILSPTEPADWKDGEWWYEEITDPVLSSFMVEIHTIPFDNTKPFHIEIDGDTETILNATDDEQAATPEDLIIT